MQGPLTTLKKARLVFADPDSSNLFTVPKFMSANKGFLIIVADPETDRIFVGHKGRFANARIRSARGRATHVVRDVLKKSQFNRTAVDSFIIAVADSLKVSLPDGNQFYQMLDGLIFNVAKSLREAKKAKKQKRAERPPAQATPSPMKIGAGGKLEGEL